MAYRLVAARKAMNKSARFHTSGRDAMLPNMVMATTAARNTYNAILLSVRKARLISP